MKMYTLICAAVVGALVLQGCATSGGAHGSAAPLPAAAPGPVVTTPAGSRTVPEVDGKPVVRADTQGNFDAIVAAIHQQMQPGGRWQYIDKHEQATIDNSFADMGKLYGRFGSVDKMDQAAKARLLADQRTVNAILTRKDGDRLVCQSEMPVGSHVPIKTCRTYAQIQAERQNAQQFMRDREVTNSHQIKTD